MKPQLQTGTYKSLDGQYTLVIDNIPGNSGKYSGTYTANDTQNFTVSEPSGIGQIEATSTGTSGTISIEASYEGQGLSIFDRWAGVYKSNDSRATLFLNGSRGLAQTDGQGSLSSDPLGNQDFELQT